MKREKAILINIGLPKNVKEEIEKIASKRNISRNAMIVFALSEFLERNK